MGPFNCIHLGPVTSETVECPTCGRTPDGQRAKIQLKVHECKVYGKCTLGKRVVGVACCLDVRSRTVCPSYKGPDGEGPAIPVRSSRPAPPQRLTRTYRRGMMIPADEVRQRKFVAVKGKRGKTHIVTPKKRPPTNAQVIPISTKESGPMLWAYGVTTVPSRMETTLPPTLKSLAAAGFDRPRLFVDGARNGHEWETRFGLEVTTRPPPPLRAYGNWVLAAIELYVRDPKADRYAIFQDDIITYPNLKQYLESCSYPERGYLNLYLFPEPWQLKPPHDANGQPITGWFLSNQRGKSACGLVFSKEALVTLLTNSDSVRHLALRPLDRFRGHRAVDGGIVEAMKKARWQEWVHYPSLLQHIGNVSSIEENKTHPTAPSFRGENFDALALRPAVGV